MSKSICALAHKKGSTREAFQLYYEESHAPLAIGNFPFTGYVRNHILDAPDFGWDTISEFWSEDIERTAALMAGPIGEMMRADEEKFMDRSAIAPAGAEEIVLSPRAREGPDGTRTALLIFGDPKRDLVLDYASILAGEHQGVSVDFATSWQVPAFPARAVIWVSGHHEAWPSQNSFEFRPIRVRRIAAPSSTLLGNGAGNSISEKP